MRSATVMLCAALFAAGAQAAAPRAAKPDLAQGEGVYQRWCSHCHDAGRGMPGTESLQVKYGGKVPALILERRDLTPEAVAVFVRQGVLSMAPFRKTAITDEELASLSAYVARNYRRR